MSTIKREWRDDSLPTIEKANTKEVPPHNRMIDGGSATITATKEWDIIQECTEEVAGILRLPFHTVEIEDKATKDIIVSIDTLLEERKPKQITVSVTGGPRDGKSTTLDSLLKVGRMVRASSTGHAITLVSNLYSAAKSNQTTAFLAEVNFFNAAERREIFKEFLRDWVGGHRHKWNKVIEVFLCLFHDQPEGESSETMRKYLKTAESGGCPAILNQLALWTNAYIAKATSGAAIATLTASTSAQLALQLEPFATKMNSSGSSLWPMVSSINFYFDHPLTSLGMKYLDTPNLFPMNQTRRNSAVQLTKQVTHWMSVADAAYARDGFSLNADAASFVESGAEQLVIVSAKPDRINPPNATEPRGSEAKQYIVRELHPALVQLDREQATLSETMAIMDLSGPRGAYLRSILNEERWRLRAKRKAIAEEVQAVQRAIADRRMAWRSRALESDLADTLARVGKAGNFGTVVEVSSVSDKDCATNVADLGFRGTPIFTIQQTNIPALRRHISTFPNASLLNDIRHQQKVAVPALLSRLELYASGKETESESGPSSEEIELHKGVKESVERAREIIDGKWKSAVDVLERDFS